jgi:hypothetical protein
LKIKYALLYGQNKLSEEQFNTDTTVTCKRSQPIHQSYKCVIDIL